MGNQPSGEQSTNPAQQSSPKSPTSQLPPAQAAQHLKNNPYETKSSGFYTQKSTTSLKVLIRGGPGAGKTALFNALQGLEFIPEYNPTEQLQYTKLPWTPHTAVSTLASKEFLQRSGTTGLHETTQFKINPQIETDISITIELVDCVDNGRRQLIPPNKLPNKSSLPPNIDLIDGNYYLPPVDTTTVDVWKNANVLLLCVDPYSLPTYHYAVNILNSIPQHLLQQGLSVMLCLMKRDFNEVDRIVTDHMLNMLTAGTLIKTLHVSTKNGYGIDKLRNSLLIPYLQLRSIEFARLSELYKQEAVLVNTYMTQLITGDADYYKYVHVDQFSNNNTTNNNDDTNTTTNGNKSSLKDDDDDITFNPKSNNNDDDDFDFMTTSKRKTGDNRFADIDAVDINDNNNNTKTTTRGKKGNNNNNELKVENTPAPKTKRGGVQLDDFFGDSGFGNTNDDDIIVPKTKEKKKNTKKTTKTQDVATTTQPTKATKPTTIPSFFDDDLDLEPIQPTKPKSKPVPRSQIGLKSTTKTTTASVPKQQNATFGGFFDDDDDDQQQQQLDPALLRPSSSHNIDEEAELAFFDGDDENEDYNGEPLQNIQEIEQHQHVDEDAELAAFGDDDNDNHHDDINSTPLTINPHNINDDEENNQVVDSLETLDIEPTTIETPIPTPIVTSPISTQQEQEDETIIEQTIAEVQTINTNTNTDGEDEQVQQEPEQESIEQIEQQDEEDHVAIEEVIETGTDADFEFNEEITNEININDTNEITIETNEIEAEPIIQSPIDSPIVNTPDGQEDDQITTTTTIPTPKPSTTNFYDDDDEEIEIKPKPTKSKVASPQVKPVKTTTPQQSTFFDDDEPLDLPTTIKTNPKPTQSQQSTPKQQPLSTPQQKPSINQGFFDDDDDVILQSKSTKKVASPQQKPMSSPVQQPVPFGDFEDDDSTSILSSPSTGTKKKVVSKKQTALEKQMALLKQQEEAKAKEAEAQAGGFQFKAKSTSFYD